MVGQLKTDETKTYPQLSQLSKATLRPANTRQTAKGCDYTQDWRGDVSLITPCTSKLASETPLFE
ncbi:Hypothetical protein HDN1F_21730 [gamma proteobacterium HdN1]|nr:Hypothetical protein HDN1F_21730 [gamma proteobacterium HdN1]